jgi:hypothetical protein
MGSYGPARQFTTMRQNKSLQSCTHKQMTDDFGKYHQTKIEGI